MLTATEYIPFTSLRFDILNVSVRMSLVLEYTTLPRASVISIIALFTSDGITIVTSPFEGLGYTKAFKFPLLLFNPNVVTN